MIESFSTGQILWRIIGWFSVFLLVGLLFDSVLLCLVLGCGGLLLWQYTQHQKLSNWLWRDRRLTPPSGKGAWENTFNGLYRLQNKNRRKVRGLAGLLRRFRQGAEAMPDAAVVLDHEFKIIWCNRLASIHLGLRWPLDQNQRIDNLLRTPEFTKYLHRRDYSDPFEFKPIQVEEQVVEIRIIPYGDSQFLLIARDIRRMRQLENMRRDFVANVSHELKTPLTVLQGYLEMMEMTAESHQQKSLTLMQQQVVRMSGLVEQLLELSRIESAQEIDMSHPVPIDAMLADLNQEALGLSRERHKLTFEIDTSLQCYGNEQQLRAAFSNLVSNAIRYSPDGGEIVVSWQAHPAGVEFAVKDQGIGVEPAHIHRLTERFYRVDRARSRDTGGSGLGLAIVKHALSQHQSELRVQSQAGQGSRFSFVIPSKYLVSPVI
ncbi:phosphate regulon sensor histidine kinase PhoR [Paraferrimonas sedimenticola]|uniref:Phosphate regulon sensor protein PhoR n=1 Tax=Paraferrimonas sedimenticola TaxID=375674 RepID=A0AA37W0M0_9GAMM|nr:phosphate regulon sensor histidine kinase PhoR [Paraferrimonas sedimenticola]GLP95217.1 PAS domain-containing sensor histidine kinase [Paraferrimonas sedimenticola]